MRRLVAASVCTVMATLTVLTCAAGDARPASPAVRNRQVFAARLGTIKRGMSEKDVVRLLGPPDDVRTETDPGGIPTTHTAKILRYGASGHLTCAMLGQVYVDHSGAVQYVFGGRGAPPSPTLVSELELARLLALLHGVSSYRSGQAYEPLPLIRAVNALQPLGKEKALAVIGEYLRISSQFDDPAREGMFLVMRVLFEVPADTGAMPRMGVGAPAPREPEDPRSEPRFPIVMTGDIPWLPINGYGLGGLPQPPEDHLIWFRAHGTLRAGRLQPPDHPLATVKGLLAKLDPWTQAVVVEQLLSLLDSVYRPDRDAFGSRFHLGEAGTSFDSEWRKLSDKLARLKIRWDRATSR